MWRCLLLALALAFTAPGALAQQHWTEDALVADMFPGSPTVEAVTLALDDDASAAFRAALGYAIPARSYRFAVVRVSSTLAGIVIFDEQVGQHEPISFAVQLAPDGTVVRQEVLVYREKYGHEVRDERFRRQFVGKGPGDALRPGKDVKIVSGATYSSRAMAIGVKRAIYLGGLLLSSLGDGAATTDTDTTPAAR